MSDWLVIRTHPNCEKMAIRNLENQDFNYRQFLISERKKQRNKFVMLPAPLFPCYIFVEACGHWPRLQSTYGVASIVMSGSRPALLKQSAIDSLHEREVDGIVQLPSKRFKVGDKVTIKDGPFAAQSALVARMPAKDRQKVLLALLANQISVLVDPEFIEAA